MALTDFLKQPHRAAELAATLGVLRTFRADETEAERLATPSVAWSKLEQLHEYLAHLVEGAPLRASTVRDIEQQERRDASAGVDATQDLAALVAATSRAICEAEGVELELSLERSSHGSDLYLRIPSRPGAPERRYMIGFSTSKGGAYPVHLVLPGGAHLADGELVDRDALAAWFAELQTDPAITIVAAFRRRQAAQP